MLNLTFRRGNGAGIGPKSAAVLVFFTMRCGRVGAANSPYIRKARKHHRRAEAMPMKDTLGVLLAGGAGERLYPLTRDRAKPAVTFGGIYRIIDITLSNCLNSDLRRVYILTQYKALSLNRHVREGWNIFGREIGEFIEILPPMKRVSENWYMGTADAVYQNIYSIGSEQPKYVLILSGDHIYKMNYERMLQQHTDSGAHVTVATLLTEPEQSRHFGVVDIDAQSRIT